MQEDLRKMWERESEGGKGKREREIGLVFGQKLSNDVSHNIDLRFSYSFSTHLYTIFTSYYFRLPQNHAATVQIGIAIPLILYRYPN